MELLHRHHPPHLHGISSSSRFFSPETAEVGGSSEKLYIAVGEKVEKALTLLQWSFNQFGGCEFCLLHIYKHSPLIPTLLGNLPAIQANSQLVNAYRGEEKEKMRRFLDIYLGTCARAKEMTRVWWIQHRLFISSGHYSFVQVTAHKALKEEKNTNLNQREVREAMAGSNCGCGSACKCGDSCSCEKNYNTECDNCSCGSNCSCGDNCSC